MPGRYEHGTDFKSGHVNWNSEAGRAGGEIVRVHTKDVNYKGCVHHEITGDSQYEFVETYLTVRRVTGFAMQNAECLLKSFAAFAAEPGQTHVHTQTAIDWAALGPSVAQRDARLKAVCLFERHVWGDDARHELPPANHFGARKTR